MPTTNKPAPVATGTDPGLTNIVTGPVGPLDTTPEPVPPGPGLGVTATIPTPVPVVTAQTETVDVAAATASSFVPNTISTNTVIRYLSVSDESIAVSSQVTNINFVGTGVSVANNANAINSVVVTIDSGGTYGNSNVVSLLAGFGSNSISTTGNVTVGYVLGNGSQLTGLAATYSNANVQVYLPTYSGNIGALTVTGNLTVTGTTSTVNTEVVNVSESVVGNIDAGNLRTAGQVSAAGNITGVYFVGNGSALSSLTGANVSGTVANATYALTSNAATYSTQATTADTANAVAGANVSGTVANATYATSAGSATTAGTVTTAAQGNITSVGTLTGLTVTGNISAGNIFGNIISGKLRSTKSIPSTVEGISGDVEGDIAIDENFLYYCYQNFPESSTFVITSNDTQTRNDIESNIPLSSVPAYVVPGWTVNLNLSGNRTITNITEVNGSATFAFSGGPVTTGYGAQYTLSAPTPDPIWVSVPLTSFESPNYGNANVSAFLAAYGNNTVSTTGNITAGNITAANLGNIASLNLNSNASTVLYGNGTFASLPASYGNSDVTTLLGNLGSNVISSTGNITTTANISGAYVKGNGSELTNLPAPTVTQDITSVGAMSIMTYDGNLKYASYATVEPVSGNIAGNNISASGNITANNLGNISTINLTGSSSNVLYGNGTFAPAAGGGAANTGNVTFNDVNIIGDGNLKLQPNSANAGSYLDIFLTVGPDLHLVSNAANLILGTDEEANVAILTDGNVAIQAGNVGGTHTWNFGTDGNLAVPGNINFSGDACAAPSLNDFFSVTSAVDFSIIAHAANTNQTWSFDTAGNLTLPGNTFAVNYANGTAVSLGSGTVTNVQGDGIVSGLSLTGNVTTTGNLTLGGTLDLSSLSGNISTTGNITGGNVLTGGGITATGNITGGNLLTNSRVVMTPVAYSALAAVSGARAFINDGNLAASGNFGAQVIGGASNVVPVWSDGANWYIG